MKNVKGEEIYSSQEEKNEYYNTIYSNTVNVNDYSYHGWHVKVKDDYFNTVLIPFCLKMKIKTALDVGADFGKYAVKLYEHGIEVTASEITPERHEFLRGALDKNGYQEVKTICADIESMFFPEPYDLIFLSDIVEHLETPIAAWNKCILNSKYIYALIPKEDSWNWSPDHIVRFDDEKIAELVSLADDLVSLDVLDYDESNSWYALTVRGMC
jgi:2-polyprenyl-3-methyl-5-hydroxy-6-metoxy-1,4-benzoquinol methylase